MKKQFLFLISALLCMLILVNNANATKWRINNKAGSSAHFTTPQIAHDDVGVLNGDTLLVEGSTVRYGDATFTKKLVIIGPGYFLAENAETQANLATANLEDVTFSSGSDSSIMMGIRLSNGNSAGLYIGANAVTIKRCQIFDNISINGNDVMMLQNYVDIGATGFAVAAGYSSVIIQNNYIYTGSYAAIDVNVPSTVIISHNVIYGDLNLNNCIVSNNIWRFGDLNENVNNSFMNNICNGTQFPGASDTTNVDMATVFELSGSTDGQWQLLENSPAKGFGIDSVDCGMFGGVDPYVLSGLPAIPAIYFFSAPSTASTISGLPVNIKIKSHK